LEIDPDLLAAFAAFLQEHQAKKRQAGEALTNAQLWDKWYPSVEQSARGPNIRTHRKYAMALRFDWQGREVCLGDLTPAECPPEIFEAWRLKLRTHKGHRGTLLSPAYRDQIRLSMQAMWTYHVETGTVDKNPLKGVPREDGWEGRKRMGYPTKEQLDRFLPHCRPVLGAMLKLSFRSGGMRRDEMRLLTRSEVHWENREIALAKDRTKGKRERRIVLTEDSMEILHHYAAISPSEYVFANPCDKDGGPIPKSTLWGWLEEARLSAGSAAKLGSEPFVIHSARHGYVMRMMGRAPEAWIADQVGHRDTTMIADRYGAMRTQEDRDRFRELAEKEKTPPPERKAPAQAPRAILPTRATK
jgi:integrase